jgi:hemolysin III
MKQMKKVRRILNLEVQFTPKQELIHSYLHALGVLFGVFAIPILLSLVTSKDIRYLFSCFLYSLGFIMTFTFSTLFHYTKKPGIKKTFKLLDYISIYLLIAGTYTPLIVHYMFNDSGLLFLYTIWSLALMGIVSKILLPRTQGLISVAFYLFIGLMFLFFRKSFFLTMPFEVSMLIICGVILYCVGIIFYLWRNWPYHHAVWHLLVLIAGLCHFSAILLAFQE